MSKLAGVIHRANRHLFAPPVQHSVLQFTPSITIVIVRITDLPKATADIPKGQFDALHADAFAALGLNELSRCDHAFQKYNY